jgi:glycogen debranching enzyme
MRKEAYKKAIFVLEKCATPDGFFAGYPGYDAIWARDSMIISLGASLIGHQFKETFKQSIITLARHQSPKGQIPNAVDIFSNRKPHVDFQSVDSSLWYIIGNYIYKSRYKDNSLFESQKESIERALTWLSYLDTGEDHLPEQLPTTDWQDAFPHRYGHTINTQALYYKALNLVENKKEADIIKDVVNNNTEVGLWNGKFYYPYRWKNHNKYQEKGEWFDSLGNILAIIFDLATPEQAEKIISYIQEKKIDKPYPVKTIYPPIKEGTKDWQDYFLDCEARTPFHYSNGGIWPYIGGFYILALIKCKKFDEASRQLDKLAEANMKLSGAFTEWLHGKNGKPYGGNHYQGWNAGAYILAYDSLVQKKVLL